MLPHTTRNKIRYKLTTYVMIKKKKKKKKKKVLISHANIITVTFQINCTKNIAQTLQCE